MQLSKPAFFRNFLNVHRECTRSLHVYTYVREESQTILNAKRGTAMMIHCTLHGVSIYLCNIFSPACIKYYRGKALHANKDKYFFILKTREYFVKGIFSPKLLQIINQLQKKIILFRNQLYTIS